jgi:hypothetical protein
MAYTINDIRSVDNPQRAFEYEVEILGASVAGTLPIMSQRVESVTIPEETLETIEINFKGRKSIYTGRDGSPHTVTVNFWDDETRQTYRYFRSWLNNELDAIVGGGVVRSQYKGELLVKMFATDSQTVRSIHRFTTVFPISVGEISLNYTDSAHLTFSVTFSYDTHQLDGVGGGSVDVVPVG